MESNSMLRQMVRVSLCVTVAALFCVLIARPAFAQDSGISEKRVGFEFEGSWNQVPTEDNSTDPIPVDYMGLPLNDAARAIALDYSESQLSMVERQCEGWSNPYLFQGPFGLKIWSDFDPLKGSLVSYTIGAWEDKPAFVIWMDDRPEPSQYAEHLRGGITRGHWENGTLVTVTTHMKEGWVRKNGPPMSDMATMTLRFTRHADILLMTGIIEDPYYLTEPLVYTRNFQLSNQQISPVAPPCVPTYEGSGASEVPHVLWGNKPKEFMEELTRKYGVPREAVMGYSETLYPEYHQKMKAAGSR